MTTTRTRPPFVFVLLALVACADAPPPGPDEASSEPEEGTHLVTEEGAWGVARVRTESGPQRVDYQVRGGNAIHDGDIDLGPVRRLFERGGATNIGHRWPNNTVLFAFDPDFGPGTCATDSMGNSLNSAGAANCVCWTGGTRCVHVRTRAREIIADLDARTPVRFVEVSPNDSRHKMLIRWGGDTLDETPGRSEVGYMDDIVGDNYQHMTFRKAHPSEDPDLEGLGPYNFQPVPGTMWHELLHTIGIWHEQARSDRDDFVVVHDECLDNPGNNYMLRDESTNVGPYEFRSLMHYGAWSRCATDDDDNCICPTMTKVSNGSTALGPLDGPLPWDPDTTDSAFADLTADDKNTVFHMYATAPDTNAANEHFGSSFAVADFDDDGYDDVAIGVPDQSVAGIAGAGYVIVYKGTATGLVFYQEVSATTLAGYGAVANAQLGAALAAGDINGDGFADLAMGAPGQPAGGQAGAGAVVVMLGGRNGLTMHRVLDQSLSPEGSNGTSERFGAALAMGDIAGLGRAALVVGAPQDHNPFLFGGGEGHSGAVYIFAFSTGTAPALYRPSRVRGQLGAPAESFGTALAIGDFDGDGAHRDLAVGAPTHSSGGKVYLFAGRTPPESTPFAWSDMATFRSSIVSPWTNASFGAALAIGNLHQADNLRPELAVGAPAFLNNTGAVRVFELQTDGTATLVVNSISASQQTGGRYGAAVLIADVDRSTSSADLIVGEPGATDHGGRVWIGRGGIAALPLDPMLFQRRAAPFADEDTGDQFGAAFAVGELDGWGNVPSSDDRFTQRRDLIIGAPGAAPDLASFSNPNAPEDPAGAGAAYVFLGASNAPPVGADSWHQERAGRL